jgi:CRISPR/Cas system-associated exonuclease Cas4 (RecB family)
LEIFSRNEKTPPSKELLEIFKRGFLFEENVRNALYPSGINVKETLGDFSYFESYTAYLLNQPGQSIIYEATLIEERVFVMCDILIKNEDGFVDIYEIKSSTSVNDAIISDLSIQYAISKKRFQSKLRSFNLVLRKDAEDFDFEIVNLTEELDKKFDTVTEKISAFIKLLRDGEPDIKMGQQCQKPYLCEFVEYCSRKV